MTAMNAHHKNALVATLARIDKQILESGALLLKLPTGAELIRLKDELGRFRQAMGIGFMLGLIRLPSCAGASGRGPLPQR
jgi:hypothetical protein